MDSITHVVLGACLAEVIGRKGNNRVLLAGAAAQSLPDIDFVASFWLNPASDLLAHRGFTHSFLFVALAAPPLAWITDRYLITRTFPLRKWILFYLFQVFIHVFIDAFNAYGTGWFEPFSHARVSFNALFVADPFFTLPLVVCCGLLFFWSPLNTHRRKLTMVVILWCCFYIWYSLGSKTRVNRATEANIRAQGITVTNYLTTPTPLNTCLWYVVANNDSGSYVGYRSIFDEGDSIAFEFFPRQEFLLDTISGDAELQQLKRFSQGYYTVEKWDSALVFNDLRFGQMIGWRDRRAGFVFHYYLNPPGSNISSADNQLIVQRGRFQGWDMDAARSLRVRAFGGNLTDREPPAGNRK